MNDEEMKEHDQSMVIDDTDRRLLDLLQQDAGMTNQALAHAAHVSAATCLRRVRRLEELGVVQRRVALLDPGLLGPSLTVISEITLDRQGAEHLTAFEALVVADPAVSQCYRVSPGPDFLLILQAADMDSWAAVVDRLFTQNANVRNVKSFFSVRRAKFDTRVPVAV